MISNKKLIHVDKILKENLKKALNQNNFDLALRLVELSSHLQYNYCFNNTLYDKELEDSLKIIADSLFKAETIIPEQDTVLFYDYFGYDNRGLTQQYLRALQRLNKRIVLVFESKNRQYKNEAILSEIENYDNKSIYYLEGNNRIELCKNLINILLVEKPQHILMHLIPWDTIAYMAFYKIKGVQRYQINLTDHSFWLGVDITDINIEFRSYGLNLSEQLRDIPKEKSRILPYYPILSKTPFQGFDFNIEGKKIIFSGSSFYKILGKNFEFLETINKLLNIDENLIFLFAGSGNSKVIEDFIHSNGLNNRIYLIGDRYDLYEVMKKADYYICTFPFAGALMTQIAAASGLPIFAYVNPECLFNDLKDLFYKSDTFKNVDNTNQLIEDFAILHKKEVSKKPYSDSMINEEEFAMNLDEILKGNNPMSFLEKRKDVSGSYQSINELMITSENIYNPDFDTTVNKYLSTAEKFKILPGYKIKYYKKLLKENKILFLKILYYQITGKL
ncbi:hypothetical protein [Chryseobacterium sp.]|jgi:glycosyltransferase involved in cell wall biosynthesis|uniref:glycosyltransferase n=1 Tax=Chryseobacterium sp. TaxID=1871047 RepID=UPI00283B2422|nr:hypothetical protein [Chryseobacterium sp.]MDR3024446.1 glycosyltransferase family 4 protein [Chryseobacterium sp.]